MEIKTTQNSALYLSPHLDDVVFSCGGQIHQRIQRGQAVTILTVMAAPAPLHPPSKFAKKLHKRWQFSAEEATVRRHEDRRAAAILGAEVIHWDELDAIYRLGPLNNKALYPSWKSLFAPPVSEDGELIERLQTALMGLHHPGPVFAPLALGNHVDHRLIRCVAERVFSEKMFYYEDFPYCLNLPYSESLGSKNGSPAVIPLSEKDKYRRLEAMGAYQSQLPNFWKNEAALRRDLLGYLEAVGGERIWSLKGDL